MGARSSIAIWAPGLYFRIAALVAMGIGIQISGSLVEVAPGSKFHGEWQAEQITGVSMQQATYNLMQRYLAQVRGAKGFIAK